MLLTDEMDTFIRLSGNFLPPLMERQGTDREKQSFSQESD